jgi:hypothetical protein
MGRTFRSICIVVGILSIIADVATVPSARVGTTYCGSSGAAFCPLFPYNLPILAIIGAVVGLASITMAFASGKGAELMSSIAAGFALTFISASGSWVNLDAGWPLPWAHQFYYLGPIQSQLWFYVDILGLLIDIVFWAVIVFAAINLVRLLLHKPAVSS